jgi:hypothetical protein
MKMSILLAVIILGAAPPARSQVTPPAREAARIDRSIFGLGISAGVASGFGLSFRQHMPGELSYQLIGGIIKTDIRTHYNLGGELQFDLRRGQSSRFFAEGAMGYFYSGESGHNDLEGPLRMGAGIGGEWSNGAQPLAVTLEILFTYFSDGTVLPLPQASLHYYFF